MILTPLVLDVKALGLGNSSGARAIGLHASTVYNDYYADINPKKYSYDGPPDPMLVEIGLIFEKMLEEGLIRRLAESGEGEIIRPGEFAHTDTYDGKTFTIHFNPDLFIFNGIGLRVGEIKSTWQWSKLSHAEIKEAQEDIVAGHMDSDVVVKVRDTLLDPKYDKYWSQLRFYCHMLQCLFGRFYVFWVTANGRPPFPAQMISVDVEFTQDELDQEYRVMIMHANSKGMLK